MDRPQAILMLGPTGSGKTPLGDLLEQRGLWQHRCCHFDFGSHLRRIVTDDDPPDYLDREDVAFLYTVLNSGALLEDEQFYIAERILCSFISQRQISDGAFVVLNGLPRHVGQAEDVDQIVRVHAVVELSCTPEVVFERIRSNAGGDRTGRSDDSLDVVRNKLAIYNERTAPLLDHYRTLGVNVQTVVVDTAASAETILAILESRR